MLLEDFIQDFNETVSLLTFCLGALFGNRLAIARDRRKEFNAAAGPIRKYLLAEINGGALGGRPPSNMEMDDFIYRLSWIKRRRFLKAYKEQQEEREKSFRQNPNTGEVYYESTEGIIESLKKCLPYTNPK